MIQKLKSQVCWYFRILLASPCNFASAEFFPPCLLWTSVCGSRLLWSGNIDPTRFSGASPFPSAGRCVEGDVTLWYGVARNQEISEVRVMEVLAAVAGGEWHVDYF